MSFPPYIETLPDSLQAAIQQGYLGREFEQPLKNSLAYRQIAQRRPFPNQIGETFTATRGGLLPPVIAPLDPRTNTNLDNGLTPDSWNVEQYVMTLNQYASTQDLNVVTSGVAIASVFLENAMKSGTQACQSLDGLARDALFGPANVDSGGYLESNTYVNTALGSPSTTLQVNDIRGFRKILNSQGKLIPVDGSNTMPVMVGANIYQLSGAAADTVNVSSARDVYNSAGAKISGVGGISGVLTFTTSVATLDGALNSAVTGFYAPAILRPNARTSTAGIVNGDYLTMSLLLDGVSLLENNAVPTVDGLYHLYADNKSLRQLFADPEFQLLYRGRGLQDPVYRSATVYEGLKMRFIPTTIAPQQLQTATTGRQIRRPILCGADVLVEGTFANQKATMESNMKGMCHIEMVDDIMHIVRPPFDRLGQIVAQSWSWIGGYAVPTDSTTTPAVVPTASNAYKKRAVIFETA